jgi:hypothetical protein
MPVVSQACDGILQVYPSQSCTFPPLPEVFDRPENEGYDAEIGASPAKVGQGISPI